MKIFDEDDIDDNFNEFFSESSVRDSVSDEWRGKIQDFAEDDKYIYFIFELPGYNEGDVSVRVNGNVLEIIAKKKEENMKEYLAQRLYIGVRFNRVLPNFIKSNSFDYSLKNGILEIKFEKRKM